MKIGFCACLAIAIILTACSSSRKLATGPMIPVSRLNFIAKYEVKPGQLLNGAEIGGLSSIDYDSSRGLYYLICDDPSTKGPARFFTAKISLTATGIDTVVFTNVTTVQTPAGTAYADIRKDRTHSLDAESMRYNPLTNEMVIGSEGQRVLRDGHWLLQSPQVFIQRYDGSFVDSLIMPAHMKIDSIEKGPRHNAVFEGLTFTDNYKHVFVNTESAIYDDGPASGNGDTTSWIRLLKFDLASRKLLAEYAYQLDPVPYPPTVPGAFIINGMTDMLSLGHDRFLVIERAFSTGRGPADVRVYLADASKATNVANVISLHKTPPKHAVTKTQLVNFENLGIYIDNVEGATFGPLLPNGHRSLIYVVDNDFLPARKMQFFLFEVIP